MVMRNMSLSLCLIFLFSLFGCSDIKTEVRREFVYWFNPREGGGYMIRSWNSAERDKQIELRKKEYSLDDDWIYFDETFEMYDIGNIEFFIQYECSFINKKTDVFKRIEEAFYCSSESILFIPVMLKRTYSTINIYDPKLSKIEKVELLWGNRMMRNKSFKNLIKNNLFKNKQGTSQ